MPKRRYSIRINVIGEEGSRRGNVSISDETMEMFNHPYYSVKRMQDRLAFVPWDKKTGQGYITINNNAMQFGKQPDCEKMLDLSGEYGLISKTGNDVVYVKLADRLPFEVKVENRKSPTLSRVAYPAQHPGELAEMIEAALKKKCDERDELKAELQKLREREEELNAKLDGLHNLIIAYMAVYKAERGGEE